MDQIKTLFPKFKAAAEASSPNVAEATALLTELKKAIVSLKLALASPAAIAAKDATLAAQAAAARDVFESASYFSAKTGDAAGFERHFLQLKPFYSLFAPLLPASAHRLPLTGLFLLYLVSAQPARLAEFHSELEQLPAADVKDGNVAFAFNLERALMEGSYTTALALRSALPLPAHGAAFFDMLEGSVRTKVADCIEVAYASYPIARLGAALGLASDSAVTAFVAQRGWKVEGGRVVFPAAGAGADADAAAEGGAVARREKDMSKLLDIATRIERIV